MPARPGESEEDYRKRRDAERSSRPKETEEERAARKSKEAGRPRETEEERAARKAKEAAEGKTSSSRPKETEEERAARKAKEAARGKETEEERAARKAREAAEGKTSSTRPRETEEERAARKAKEAAEGKTSSSRPKETEEERAARKAKEREREKQKEAERADKKIVRVEANIGSVHKTADAVAAKPPREEPKVQARPTVQQQDDDDDDYGDDDFVDAAEAEALERARKAMEAENDRIRKAMAARRGGAEDGAANRNANKDSAASANAAKSGNEVTGKSQISVDDLQRQKYRAQFEEDLSRATALRRLVDLESVSVTIADIAPMSEYDLYIRSFGGSERVQTAVQAPPEADIVDEEVQAERVVMKSKGAQAPEDLGLFPERQMVKGFGFGAGTSEEEVAAPTTATVKKKDKKEKEGKEKKDKSSSEKEKSEQQESAVATTSSTSTQSSAAPNNKNNAAQSILSFDTASLSAFLTRVFPVVRTLLDESEAAKGVGFSSVKVQSKHSFSTTTTDLHSPLTEGRAVIDTQFSKAAPQNVVALYGAPGTGDVGTTGLAKESSNPSVAQISKYPSVALLWNVNDPTTADKVLLSTVPLTSVCCSPVRPHLIYGGTASGSVCVWDLREANYRHAALPDGTTARLPSFSTEWLADNHDYPVVQVVVAGYNASLAHRNKDESETLTSIDSRGSCHFWLVNEDTVKGGRGGASVAIASPTSQSKGAKDGFPLTHKSDSPTGSSKRKGGAFNDNDHGQNVFSSVKLFKASAMNLLPLSARADAVSCCEFFPSDPTQMVAGSSDIVHLNRYGAITAPSRYTHYARWTQSSSASPVTSLHFSPLDSRVLLASYQDGTVRLFLKDSGDPKLTIALAAAGAIARVRCSPSLRWVSFALDTTGTFYTLDHASNDNKNGFIQKAFMSTPELGKCVIFDVSHEERSDSRVIFGFETGALQVHTLATEALKSEASLRNERWL